MQKFILFIMVFFQAGGLPAESLPDVFDSIARIRLETSQAMMGSATAWIYSINEKEGKTYWISCGHGMDVEVVKSYPIIWNRSEPRLGSILFKRTPLASEDGDKDLLNDISVLRTEKKEGDKVIPLASSEVKTGDILTVTCFEKDYPARLFKVSVLGITDGVILVEPGFAPGMSGSPLVNTRGEVVGVVLWSMILGPHQVFGKAVSIQPLAPKLAEVIRN